MRFRCNCRNILARFSWGYIAVAAILPVVMPASAYAAFITPEPALNSSPAVKNPASTYKTFEIFSFENPAGIGPKAKDVRNIEWANFAADWMLPNNDWADFGGDPLLEFSAGTEPGRKDNTFPAYTPAELVTSPAREFATVIVLNGVAFLQDLHSLKKKTVETIKDSEIYRSASAYVDSDPAYGNMREFSKNSRTGHGNDQGSSMDKLYGLLIKVLSSFTYTNLLIAAAVLLSLNAFVNFLNKGKVSRKRYDRH